MKLHDFISICVAKGGGRDFRYFLAELVPQPGSKAIKRVNGTPLLRGLEKRNHRFFGLL